MLFLDIVFMLNMYRGVVINRQPPPQQLEGTVVNTMFQLIMKRI